MPIQKRLQQQWVFERVFGNFGQFTLAVVFDPETVSGNIRNLSFLLGLHDNIGATRFFIPIPHSDCVLAIDNNVRRAIIVRLKVVIDS